MPFSTPPRDRALVICGPHSLPPTTPPSHSTQISAQIAEYASYLDHGDPAVRLVSLRAVREYIDALIAKEYAAVRPTATPQPEPHWVRELVRRFLR